MVTIGVKDTGIGIKPDQLSRLFKPFFQADSSTTRNYGGTGLGLSISYKLAELLGGSMWVESCPGVGSSFYFSFPAPASFNVCSFKIPQKSVLLVHPVGMMMDALKGWLEPHGVTCSTASKCSRTVSEKPGGPFDMIIVDDELSDEFTMTAPSQSENSVFPPIVVLTNSASNNGNPRITEYSKPLRYQQFLSTIHAILTSTATPKPPLPSPKIPTNSIERPGKLLVADDNNLNLQVILKMLQKLGYEADTASNGKEALDRVTETTYDLVFMDIQMPEMDGLQATKAIRELNTLKKQPIIVALTANAFVEDRDACMESGMNEFLAKPVNLQKLKQTLKLIQN